MAPENISIDLSEHYGDVDVARPEDRVTLLSFLPVFRRHWLPCCLIFLSGLSLSILSAFLLPGSPSYKATGKLLFQANDTQSELTGIAEDLDPLETTGILTDPLNTQASLLTSGFLVEDVITNLNLQNEEGELRSANYIFNNLLVESVTGTDILEVSFQSEDSQEAAQIVNELMRLFILFSEQEQKAEITAAKSFLDKQLPRFQDELNDASRALEIFKVENQVVALDLQAADLTSLMKDLEQQLKDVQITLNSSEARAAELSQKLNINTRDALDLSTLNDSSGIQEVLEELHGVETELAKQSGLYLPQHPTIINLKNQADQLTQLLEERIGIVLGNTSQVARQDLQLGSLRQSLLSDLVQVESERILLERQLADLNGLRAEYLNRALTFPSLERREFDLTQNLENAQRSYNELLQRAQEIQLAEIQIDGSNYVQIIGEATPPQVVISKFNPVVLGLGSALSFIFSILVCLILERRDKTVKTADELVKILDYPLLGLVPEFSELGQGNVLMPNSSSSELLGIYRSIYSSLKVVNLEEPTQVMAVTSSIHQEGKSEVAANLAAAIAQSGRRVLLIDADLRTPVQHQLWQMPNDVGLSNLLSEKASLNTAVHQLNPYLSVMTSGLAIADPSLFFESSRMTEMLREAKTSYDYIIFDASPLLAEPDALLLGQVSEGGLIFVGQPKHVQKSDVLAASELIELAKLKVMGLVINRVSSHEQRVSRVPFSHAYQIAGESALYQNNGQPMGAGNISIPDSMVHQTISNRASKGEEGH